MYLLLLALLFSSYVYYVKRKKGAKDGQGRQKEMQKENIGGNMKVKKE